MASLRFAALLIVLIVSIKNCLSYNCYECNGETECHKNVTEMTQRPCVQEKMKCFKVTNPETDKAIQRGCGLPDICDIFTECYTCGEEFCNSSSQILPFFGATSFIAIILTKILYVV